MIRSYLRVALRSLKRNKLISFINIFGLGLSMSVGLMILIRLMDEVSFDSFHPHPDRTFRITSTYAKKNSKAYHMASTSLPLLDKVGHDLQGIEAVVCIYPAFGGKATADGKELYLGGAYTQPAFFQVFGFKLLQGDPATALRESNSVVISKKTAANYFGSSNALGKTFVMENGKSLVVTGVMAEPPTKSHINFDALVSYSTVTSMEKDKLLPEKSNDWFSLHTAYTYVLLKKGFRESAFNRDLASIAKQLNGINKEGTVSFSAQSIERITPGTDFLYHEIGKGSSWTKFYFEIGIALIILLAACFNYTNLTIARSLTRAREVGIRKINGAKRSQVFLQYIIEAVLLSFLALAFAWVIIAYIVEYAPFNDDYEFIPSSFQYNLPLFAWSVAFALFAGLLAGVAPSWILSSFKPLRVLKSLVTAKIMGRVSLQKSLIVFQYSLSLTIIIFLVAFYRQFAFLSSAETGFRRDHVLVVPLGGADKQVAANAIASIPGTKSVGSMSSPFTKHFSGLSTPMWLANKQESVSINYYYADKTFIQDMGFKFIVGSNFLGATDEQNANTILLNEQAVRALGFKDYRQSIGQSVWLNDTTRAQIAGVIKDFNYEAAGTTIRPIAFRSAPGAFNFLYVSTGDVNRKDFAVEVNQAIKNIQPTSITQSTWLEDDLESNNSQRATISLLGYLAFMAIAIASLGLLGLVIYTVQVKRKEISIRKIVGAGEKQLVKMLSYGFVKLLLIAGLIAIPLGYAAGFFFLQGFPARVSPGIGSAFLCFLFLFAIGFLTIISQTYRAATANPAKDLRGE